MKRKKKKIKSNGKPSEPKVVGKSFMGYYLQGGEAKSSHIIVMGDDAILYDARKKKARLVPASAVATTVGQLLRRKKAIPHYHISRWSGKMTKVHQAKEETGSFGAFMDGKGATYSGDQVFKTKLLALRSHLKSRLARLRQNKTSFVKATKEFERVKRRVQAEQRRKAV